MRKRVLVTWGSKLGGTEGIARVVADTLEASGFEVVAVEATSAPSSLESFDAAVIGGGLYVNRWNRHARRFVERNIEQLRRIPVWLFSSGPLDHTASERDIAPTEQVASLAERVGAVGHATFGGRLEHDAPSAMARAMARKVGGDWRDPLQIRMWAGSVAEALPDATPGLAIDHPGRSFPRLLGFGVIGWALCAATIGESNAAIAVHAIASPLFFFALSALYFARHGARDPLPTALAWTAMVGLFDLLFVAAIGRGSLAMFSSFTATWLPLGLIFLSTWGAGRMLDLLTDAGGTGGAGEDDRGDDADPGDDRRRRLPPRPSHQH